MTNSQIKNTSGFYISFVLLSKYLFFRLSVCLSAFYFYFFVIMHTILDSIGRLIDNFLQKKENSNLSHKQANKQPIPNHYFTTQAVWKKKNTIVTSVIIVLCFQIFFLYFVIITNSNHHHHHHSTILVFLVYTIKLFQHNRLITQHVYIMYKKKIYFERINFKKTNTAIICDDDSCLCLIHHHHHHQRVVIVTTNYHFFSEIIAIIIISIRYLIKTNKSYLFLRVCADQRHKI